MDKFANYYKDEDKIQELSEYVHLNFKLIHTKMLSEMRRKLDIAPDMTNQEGYLSLMISLYGRMFNEMIYSLAGFCQSLEISLDKIIPITSLKIFMDLWEGNNPLKGRLRSDVKDDIKGFHKYYCENIEKLREDKNALPK